MKLKWKIFRTYKTIKVNCLDNDGFNLIMRVKIQKSRSKEKINSIKPSNVVYKKKCSKK